MNTLVGWVEALAGAHQMLYAILIRPSFSCPVIGATRLNPKISWVALSFPTWKYMFLLQINIKSFSYNRRN